MREWRHRKPYGIGSQENQEHGGMEDKTEASHEGGNGCHVDAAAKRWSKLCTEKWPLDLVTWKLLLILKRPETSGMVRMETDCKERCKSKDNCS